MSVGGAAALAAGSVFALVVSVVLFAVALARTAAHADEVSLEHERQQQAAVTGTERRTARQGIADLDLQLAMVSDLLEVWPGDAWLLGRRDELLDDRSRLASAAATAPRSRVVRQAAHP